MNTKTKKGGYKPMGRPPTGRKRVLVSLDPKALAVVERLAARHDTTKSLVIEKLIKLEENACGGLLDD